MVSLVLDAADPGALEKAAAALAQGRLVVVPTDTVYGIAGRLDRPAALGAIFETKRRPPGLALPVLVADLDQARAVALIDDGAATLAAAFWPGALTMVLPRQPALTADLGGDGISVGVRVPRHPSLQRLLAATGPLATSSANPSGTPTPVTVQEIEALFGDAVAVYLDGGPAGAGPASTVVALTGPCPVILREGGVSLADILAAARWGGAR